MNGIQKALTVLCAQLLPIMHAAAQSQVAINDGPYLFYETGKPILKTIRDNQVVTFANPDNVEITFKDHPDWNFVVAIKGQLDIEPSEWKKPDDKLLVISDIEGEFEVFRALLLANKVVDSQYNWIYGKGQLVIDGDLFDRGSHVTEYLWLLYKLEQDATSKGGYVHTILGNHDIMNLSGDLRYVLPKYKESAQLMGVDYMRLYDENTELGRWLRTKNVMERIGDQLFMHAGLSPEILKLHLSVPEINEKCRPFLATPKKSLPDTMKVFFGKDSPFWYRGYFMAPRATLTDVDLSLNYYQCKRIIVGHTILDRNIALYYRGKVLGIDVDAHSGKCSGALFKHNRWYIINDKGIEKKLRYKKGNDIIKDSDVL
ncbi:metallophosphoesterase [Chitinophaga arvensicola]|uniref:Calcineurin-like phosphoesterase n=1 Tax=Chitinophaga arvensicola TaxID=29529 RepID=A0A1I0S7J5_9BACT|nr:metallophosphoesterase [Chitinophaga arvensicola]SEW51589.1 Calcineurin-like phosphoesterase [Chitinophaga arvensicola]